MAASAAAATAQDQPLLQRDAAPTSLFGLFAAAAATAEGSADAVLSVYAEVRRRFSAAARDAEARERLLRSCLPAAELLATVAAHLDSAVLQLCANGDHHHHSQSHMQQRQTRAV